MRIEWVCVCGLLVELAAWLSRARRSPPAMRLLLLLYDVTILCRSCLPRRLVRSRSRIHCPAHVVCTLHAFPLLSQHQRPYVCLCNSSRFASLCPVIVLSHLSLANIISLCPQPKCSLLRSSFFLRVPLPTLLELYNKIKPAEAARNIHLFKTISPDSVLAARAGYRYFDFGKRLHGGSTQK